MAAVGLVALRFANHGVVINDFFYVISVNLVHSTPLWLHAINGYLAPYVFSADKRLSYAIGNDDVESLAYRAAVLSIRDKQRPRHIAQRQGDSDSEKYGAEVRHGYSTLLFVLILCHERRQLVDVTGSQHEYYAVFVASQEIHKLVFLAEEFIVTVNFLQ